MDTYKGLSIPEFITQDDNRHFLSLDPRSARDWGCGHSSCLQISCVTCLFNYENKAAFEEWFKSISNSKTKDTTKMSKINKPKVLDNVAEFDVDTKAMQIFVPVEYDMDEVQRNIERHTHYMLTPFKPHRLLFVCAPHVLEGAISDLRRNVEELYGERSVVDDFLQDTDACTAGAAFVDECKSMAEVWDLCVNNRKWEYINFIISRIDRSSTLHGKYVTNSANFTRLTKLWSVVYTSEDWRIYTLDTLRELNPFKQ